MDIDRNEAETRAELIDPALADAGWGKVDESRIRREVIAPGRLIGGGKRAKADIADYVLIYRGQKLAVVEAKAESKADTEGLAQAKRYSERLQARFAYSTNGHGIYRVDMATGEEGYVERYPTPDELWSETFEERNEWRERFANVPFEDKGGAWEARYYQHNAINNALEAVAKGEERILLTLATGTGKTFIGFQLAWKLYHSRWNIKDWKSGEEPKRRPRILFLADRNILADQGYNSFSAFPEDALVRISPDEIRKKGRVPKNGNIFFTIFQTFMSGIDENGEPAPSFGDYSPDFFDFIIIDECHRGGANNESSWRFILEYFESAVQLGLTATPKRKGNVDTYDYFGKPVYIYSLKEGINDGYLTPFKVKQIATTMDDYTYTGDDVVVEGVAEEGAHYGEEAFNRAIVIPEREAFRVEHFMGEIDQSQKTLVFCATQQHALMVRDLINQNKKSSDPNYCVRVVADDGEEGERWLRTFQDNEKIIPTILTTSQKLSTGVDARNVRNIVLMRPVNSMIEFKQIVGRGTRLYDGKDYFTIYDFVKAYEHFNDEEWDGEPLDPEACKRCGEYPCVCRPEPCSECGEFPCVCEKTCPTCGEAPCVCEQASCPVCGEDPCICEKKPKVYIKLSDGKKRAIQKMTATTFWSTEGKPISAAQFINQLYGDLPELFKNEDELRVLWSQPETRRKLLEGLEERGYGKEQLAEVSVLIDAEDSDLFDVLSYIAFNFSPISREERVGSHKTAIFEHYNDKQQQFLSFVLDHYVAQGVSELDVEKLPELIELKYHTPSDAVAELGSVGVIRETFVGFQRYLYG